MPSSRFTHRPIVLASQSPRRREILSMMGARATVVAPQLASDETEFFGKLDLVSDIEALAAAKAHSVAYRHPDAAVLGADTIVVIDSKVIGKPANRAEAARMLRQLSGRSHEVYTAVALQCHGAAFHAVRTARTTVFFREIDDADIEAYLDENAWADKAGAYAIQEGALLFIDKIDGCFYNVMGLPVSATIALFEKLAQHDAAATGGDLPPSCAAACGAPSCA